MTQQNALDALSNAAIPTKAGKKAKAGQTTVECFTELHESKITISVVQDSDSFKIGVENRFLVADRAKKVDYKLGLYEGITNSFDSQKAGKAAVKHRIAIENMQVFSASGIFTPTYKTVELVDGKKQVVERQKIVTLRESVEDTAITQQGRFGEYHPKTFDAWSHYAIVKCTPEGKNRFLVELEMLS